MKKSDIKVCDRVLVKQQRKNKLTPTYNPTPYVVMKTEQSRLTPRNTHGHVITRNVSHFKLIPKQQLSDSDDSDNEDAQRNSLRPNAGNHQNAENRSANEEDADREEPPLRTSARVRSKPYRFEHSVYD